MQQIGTLPNAFDGQQLGFEATAPIPSELTVTKPGPPIGLTPFLSRRSVSLLLAERGGLPMRHPFRDFLCALVALAWPAAASFCQSQAPSSQQPTPAGQSASQSQSQQTQSQTPAQDKQDSVAEAARRAKAKKAAAAQGKVFTEDDLSGMKKEGISVVGTENTNRPGGTPARNGDVKDASNGEEYWRGKAQPILDDIANIDQQIAQLKENIKKYGSGGFDVTTGMKAGVAYIEDRNAQIEKLQKKKANLQKKLEDLEEEGRKAGAQPAWFR
jgi:hypothetical protein